jgi:hypothetical protein
MGNPLGANWQTNGTHTQHHDPNGSKWLINWEHHNQQPLALQYNPQTCMVRSRNSTLHYQNCSDRTMAEIHCLRPLDTHVILKMTASSKRLKYGKSLLFKTPGHPNETAVQYGPMQGYIHRVRSKRISL